MEELSQKYKVEKFLLTLATYSTLRVSGQWEIIMLVIHLIASVILVVIASIIFVVIVYITICEGYVCMGKSIYPNLSFLYRNFLRHLKNYLEYRKYSCFMIWLTN